MAISRNESFTCRIKLKKMEKIREVLYRPLRVTLRIYGGIHERRTAKTPYPTGLNKTPVFNPNKFLVETSSRSLELSNFVWESHQSPLEFLDSEAQFMETTAIFEASSLGLCPKETVFPIDIDSASTRRRLAKSLFPHPWESLLLISRYYGRSSPPSNDAESIIRWRDEFRKSCPTAFRILFTEREQHMTSEIFRHITESPPDTRIAVFVGLSHMDAIYDQLVLRCQ